MRISKLALTSGNFFRLTSQLIRFSISSIYLIAMHYVFEVVLFEVYVLFELIDHCFSFVMILSCQIRICGSNDSPKFFEISDIKDNVRI